MESMIWWEVLGCSPDADLAVMRDRYRTLAHLYHPDRWTDAPSSVKEESAFRMRQLNEAYEVAQRSLDDRKHGPAHSAPAEPSDSSSEASGWEETAVGPHPSGWRWSPPVGGETRHPKGPAWLQEMALKKRMSQALVSGDPVDPLTDCLEYVVGRRWWKLLNFDPGEGVLVFRGRKGGKTWEGQDVTVWIEPAPLPETWLLRAVAESRAGLGFLEWNEGAAILAELFDPVRTGAWR